MKTWRLEHSKQIEKEPGKFARWEASFPKDWCVIGISSLDLDTPGLDDPQCQREPGNTFRRVAGDSSLTRVEQTHGSALFLPPSRTFLTD